MLLRNQGANSSAAADADLAKQLTLPDAVLTGASKATQDLLKTGPHAWSAHGT